MKSREGKLLGPSDAMRRAKHVKLGRRRRPGLPSRIAGTCLAAAALLAADPADANGAAECAGVELSLTAMADFASEAREYASIVGNADADAAPVTPVSIAQPASAFMPDLATLRSDPDPRRRWRLGVALADAAVIQKDDAKQTGLMAEALSVADGLAELGMRDWLLGEIVERQVAAARLADARAGAALIRHPGRRADALVLIARSGRAAAAGPGGEAQRQKDWMAALCAAAKIPDEEWRAATLLDLL